MPVCRDAFSLIFRLSICVFIASGLHVFAHAADGDWAKMKPIHPQRYACGMTSAPPTIDGKLGEASWQSAPWTNDFADIQGDSQPTPRLRTRAKLIWDKHYLYIAAELSEPHVWATLTDHDSVIFHDNDFEVFIDPDGDNHEYLEFEMNALNTTWDLFLPKPYKDGGNADNSWEFSGIQSAVHVTGTLNDPTDVDTSWCVEIAIPWNSMSAHAHQPTPPKDGDSWRLGFSRVQWQHEVIDGKYQRVPETKEDNWVWSPQGIIDMHRPERWGFVQFSENPPGVAAVADEKTLPARDWMMEIYHRQRAYRSEHGHWATTLTQLGLSPSSSEYLDDTTLDTTEDGFIASLTLDDQSAGAKQWNVTHESRLWSSAHEKPVDEALERAGANRIQIENALAKTPAHQQDAMVFLISNMPDADLKSLSADFLCENVREAYLAWNQSPWKHQVSMENFLNFILPYANVSESREAWRTTMRRISMPLIEGAKTPSEAAVRLNQQLFKLVNVRYSTKRSRADQSPAESMKSGLASCTGLSILLVDACRSVGIPARLVGTPLWANNSGNHTWVEIWDNGWQFTGAAEPSGDKLNQGWFVARASQAIGNDALKAIYAVSFRRTPLRFPLVWAPADQSTCAVNVTERYATLAPQVPDGTIRSSFRVDELATGDRIAATVKIYNQDKRLVFEGVSKDERFDTNDHLVAYLPKNGSYTAELMWETKEQIETFVVGEREELFDWHLAAMAREPQLDDEASQTSSGPLESLEKYLLLPRDQRADLASQNFANVGLSKEQCDRAAEMLWNDHKKLIRESRAAEMTAQVLTLDNLKMKFSSETFGEKPKDGRSMFISMHGGGGTAASVNEKQWENQKKLYKLEEGVYVVPRGPTDTWNLWHQPHIDHFISRLIENFVVFEDVNPDKVYIMGYSAGGDGVYQLAPRMADRWAAAAMMAGHPNETSPLGLRNLPFALHMGALDAAYDRNKKAAVWKEKLAELQAADADGYDHQVTLHPDKGHWMGLQDAVAIPWMASKVRKQLPARVVWKQDDVVHPRFYWLAVDPNDLPERAEIIAVRNNQVVELQKSDAKRLTIRFNDQMMNLDQPVKVVSVENTIFEGTVDRTIAVISKTLSERGDPKGIFCAELSVTIPQ